MWERISPQRATAQHSRNQKGEDNHGWTPMDTEGTAELRISRMGNSRRINLEIRKQERGGRGPRAEVRIWILSNNDQQPTTNDQHISPQPCTMNQQPSTPSSGGANGSIALREGGGYSIGLNLF